MDTQEREISLGGLLLYIAKGWRVVLAWMLIFGLLGTLMGLRKGEERLQDMDQITVSSVLDSEVIYTRNQEYIDHSLRMQLDPLRVPTATLTYWVDTNYTFSFTGENHLDITPEIVNTYVRALQDDAWKVKLRDLVGSDMDLQYFTECLSVTSDENSFTVTIIYPDEENLEAMMDATSDIVDTFYPELSRIFGEYRLQKISDSIALKVSEPTQELQKNMIQNQVKLRGEISEAKELFTPQQEALYRAQAPAILASATEKAAASGEELAPASAQPEKKLPALPSWFNPVLCILGLILGTLLACGWRAVRYLFSDTVKPYDNVFAYLGVAELGTIQPDVDGRKGPFAALDHWLARLGYGHVGSMSQQQQLERTASNILYLCRAHGLSRVYLTGPAATLAPRVQALLAEGGVEAHVADQGDAQLANQLADTDALVLLAKMGRSTYTDLRNSIRFYKGQDKNLLGLVAEL